MFAFVVSIFTGPHAAQDLPEKFPELSVSSFLDRISVVMIIRYGLKLFIVADFLQFFLGRSKICI